MDALARGNTRRPPVWFMRQAGRYHSHYQRLRAQHEFIELCKNPDLAVEVTMGPIEDFGFDAAILFSDLLFPLEAMGMGLRYAPGPQLDWHLNELSDLARLRGGAGGIGQLEFQAEAISRLRQRLPADRALIGFVGAPFTLYAYAAKGSHEGFGGAGLQGLDNGLYAGFCEKLQGLLAANIALQAAAGANCVAIFDTSAGSLDPESFARHAAAPLAAVIGEVRRTHPQTPLIYYSRGTGPDHWRVLHTLGIQCLGVDWRHDLADTLVAQTPHWAVQGNIDPDWLLLPAKQLEPRLRGVWERVRALPPQARAAWVCGLGHGVLPGVPEDNVRLAIRIQHEVFA